MLVGFSKTGNKSYVVFGLLVLVFLGAALYGYILHAPFVFDDFSSIVDNEAIKNLRLSLSDLSNNRYLPNLSFALNYRFGNLQPFGYHLINNLIHIINGLLVYYLIILIFKTPKMADSRLSDQFVAFSAAFIFVVHPIQTQAVTYVAQRSVLMATFFYLLTLTIYLYLRLLPAAESGIGRKIIFLSFSFLAAVCAMKSKEIAFTLPVIATMCEIFFFSNASLNRNSPLPSGERLLYLLPILLTVLIIPLSMIDISKPLSAVSNDIDAVSRETAKISRPEYFLTELRVIATYLRLLIFPINQSIDYTYPIYRTLLTPQVFTFFLLHLGLFATAIYLFFISRKRGRGWRLVSFGIFWFFITLSVESSFIPIKDVIFEHRLYLPSIGFFITSTTALEGLSKNSKAKIWAVSLIIVLLSVTAFYRNSLWREPQMLWEDALAKFPKNVRAYNALSVIYKEKKDYDRAMTYLENAQQINPAYYPLYFNMGDIHYKLGNYAKAIEYFNLVLSAKPSYRFHLDSLTSLAIAYSEIGDTENAVATFQKTIRVFPLVLAPYNNLGMQYLKMGKPDLAIEVLNKALEIRESPNIYYNLSRAYTLQGNTEKSRIMKEKALLLSAN